MCREGCANESLPFRNVKIFLVLSLLLSIGLIAFFIIVPFVNRTMLPDVGKPAPDFTLTDIDGNIFLCNLMWPV